MKKFYTTMAFLLTMFFISTVFAAGIALKEPINEVLPSSGSSSLLVELGATVAVTDYAVQARGDVDIHISNTSAMTKYWTIKSGTSISLSQILGKGASLFHARSSGAADVIELIVISK